MTRKTLLPLLALAVLCCLPLAASAFPRMGWSDEVIVARSPLIVIAHLKPSSISLVPHNDKTVDSGYSWEYHATLIITETLKGKAAAKEIPIVIHYGLQVFIEGKEPEEGRKVLEGQYAKASVQIIDAAMGTVFGPPLAPDAAQDNIWFLRQHVGTFGGEADSDDFGIVDPQDLRPLASKDYFINYLAKDPAAAMKAYVEKTPKPDPRALNYLDHLECDKIIKLPDAGERVARLIPLFEQGVARGFEGEATDKLVFDGETSGAALLKVFADTKDRTLKQAIIRVWGRAHYHGCVDVLIKQLQDAEDFWNTQKPEPGWMGSNSPESVERRARFFDIQDAVYALMQIRDDKAKPILETTVKRWQSDVYAEYSHQIILYANAAMSKTE